jgi:DNA-binding transcriptional LysR family regulator
MKSKIMRESDKANKSIPPLTSLRCFDIAAQFDNFTVAAEHLFRAPSAVSHQILALEEFLGQPLFLRTGKKVVLTGVGREYHLFVREAFDLIAAATESARSSGGLRETIRLSVAPSFGNTWLITHLGSLLAHFPFFDFNITTDQYPTTFAGRDIDCEIRYGDKPLGKLEALPLCTERLVPLCSPTYLDQFAGSGDILEIATLIHTKSRKIGWADYLSANMLSQTTNTKSLSFDRSTFTLDVALDGLGIALESTTLAEDHLRKGRLIAPFGTRGIAGHTYFLVAPSAEQLHSTRITALHEWLRSSLSVEPAVLFNV